MEKFIAPVSVDWSCMLIAGLAHPWNKIRWLPQGADMGLMSTLPLHSVGAPHAASCSAGASCCCLCHGCTMWGHGNTVGLYLWRGTRTMAEHFSSSGKMLWASPAPKQEIIQRKQAAASMGAYFGIIVNYSYFMYILSCNTLQFFYGTVVWNKVWKLLDSTNWGHLTGV